MNIKTSPMHRKCEYPLCKQTLSIYNHENYCHRHLSPTYWKDKINGEPVSESKGYAVKIGK